jgi:hypothetical protein
MCRTRHRALQAIDELMSVMTLRDPVMIFAGYRTEMEGFMQVRWVQRERQREREREREPHRSIPLHTNCPAS